MATRAEVSQRSAELARKYFALASEGKTLPEIGEAFGITRQAVHIALKAAYGDAYSELVKNRRGEVAKGRTASVTQRNTARCMRIYGVSLEVFKAITQLDYSPHVMTYEPRSFAYRQQRRNATRRGVEWSINFSQWWAVWSSSGLWDQRGKGPEAYGLGRIDTSKGFAPANVVVSKNKTFMRPPAVIERNRKDQLMKGSKT